MSARPYHKRYHSDALSGFMPLSLEERGAYQTLLDLIYDRGGPVADNERLIAGYMGCSVRKWRVLRESLLEKRKIKLTRSGEITAEGFEAALLRTARQPLPEVLRQFVIERDGLQCGYCGCVEGPFEIDHVVPVARGGLDHATNLIVACRTCNRSKGSLLIAEWVR